MPNRRVKEEKIKEIVESFDYELLKWYVGKGGGTRVIFKTKDGYKGDLLLSFLKDRNGKFWLCDLSNPFSLENISLWLKLNNKNFKLLEDNFYEKSHKNLKLFCFDCNNIFYSSWNNILHHTGCGVCTGYQVSEKTSLAYLKPALVDEWISSKNNLTPYDVPEFSTEKVLWQCSKCKHQWSTRVYDRTANNTGCPKCASEQTESKIATQLKQYILENYKAETEYKIFRNPMNNYWLPYDIYIYNNIYIEIHGLQHYRINTWHKLLAKKNNRTVEEEFEYRQYLDQLKKEYAEENGVYIEIDLREIQSINNAIKYVEDILKNIQQEN